MIKFLQHISKMSTHAQPSSSFFYRVMHFSAKLGLAITCRLSVCLSVRPSVTLVDCDHIGWNTSEIISPLPGCSLRTLWVYSNGNTRIFGHKVTPPPVDLSVGDIRSQIAAEWLQIAQWRACRKPPSLFRMVPIADPLRPP